MGTSKSYESPKWPGVNPSIGSAVSSGMPSDKKILASAGVFASGYSSYLSSELNHRASASSRGGGGQAQSGGRPRGGGGGRVARARAASSGSRLAHFVSVAANSGLDFALREFNLTDFRDKPLEVFLDTLAERLAGEGGLLGDEALAGCGKSGYVVICMKQNLLWYV